MPDGTIAVYAGQGSSHSWTWLADLFESNGIYHVRFLGSGAFVKSLRERPSTTIISGGDGFAIASALSGEGFRELAALIETGGTYVGICAGAYLPLPSSIEPFSQFNVSTTRIENIDCRLGPLEGVPPRVAVKYGSCAIVHPVRGELELAYDGQAFLAPLYGGPIFSEPAEDEVLLRYGSFTKNTGFQFARRFASDIVLGKAAVISAKHGTGRLLLSGPHLEHPGYPLANRLFLALLKLPSRDGPPSVEIGKPNPAMSRALADLKVAVLGLENRSFVVGKKLWDGGRYLELVRAIEKRQHSVDAGSSEEMSSQLSQVAAALRGMSVGAETDTDETTATLVDVARSCVDRHFQLLAESR